MGAVATQASADPAYGKLGLDLMRARKSASDTLAGLLAADPMREVRQVAMVDALGRAAAHTGQTTIPEAGHIVGDGFSVQANMMLKNTVWPAMAEAYTSAKGELVDRFLAALDAAEARRRRHPRPSVGGNSDRRGEIHWTPLGRHDLRFAG